MDPVLDNHTLEASQQAAPKVICPICNSNEVKPSGKAGRPRLYCSPECSAEALRRKQAKQHRYPGERCEHCGNLLVKKTKKAKEEESQETDSGT
jgi:hypothetical protein